MVIATPDIVLGSDIPGAFSLYGLDVLNRSELL